MLNLVGPTVELFFVPCSRKVLDALKITSLQFRPYSLRRWCQFQRRTCVYFWRSCPAPRAKNLLERQTTGSILFVRFHSRASAFCRSQVWNTFKRRAEKEEKKRNRYTVYVRKRVFESHHGFWSVKNRSFGSKEKKWWTCRGPKLRKIHDKMSRDQIPRA